MPPGFVKIRHHGWTAPRHATTKLEAARGLLKASHKGVPDGPSAPQSDPPDAALPWHELLRQLTGIDMRRCPACGQFTRLRLLRVTVGRREDHGVAVGIADPELAVVRVGIAVNVEHDGRLELACTRHGRAEVVDLEP